MATGFACQQHRRGRLFDPYGGLKMADKTISDLVADIQATKPSIRAEIEQVEDLLSDLDQQRRLHHAFLKQTGQLLGKRLVNKDVCRDVPKQLTHDLVFLLGLNYLRLLLANNAIDQLEQLEVND